MTWKCISNGPSIKEYVQAIWPATRPFTSAPGASAGSRLEVRELGAFDQFVVRIEGDPAVMFERVVDELHHALVHVAVVAKVSVRLVGVEFHAIGATHREHTRLYAVIEKSFSGEECEGSGRQEGLQSGFEGEALDVADVAESVGSAEYQFNSHETSPCSVCGASSVGEPPAAGDASSDPAAGAGKAETEQHVPSPGLRFHIGMKESARGIVRISFAPSSATANRIERALLSQHKLRSLSRSRGQMTVCFDPGEVNATAIVESLTYLGANGASS